MKYKVVSNKGQGGFGVVQVIENSKGRQFALKTFHIHPSMHAIEAIAKKRFIKEAKYQQQIDHPNIVPVVEIEQTDPPSFIMALAESSMYDDVEAGVLHSGNFSQCIYDIMAGLEEIHSLGIYHRDLKPGNVLRFKKTGYAIGDFGLISLNQTGVTTLTHTGMAKTSDMYTAPEITQDLKYACVQSDIFSLGCILHDFVGQSKRIPCNEISETSEYGDVLLGATRMDPLRRFPTVAAFREALTSISLTPAVPKTQAAETVLKSLAKDIEDFDENDISKLSDFLSSSVNSTEKGVIIDRLNLDQIAKIVNEKKQAAFIGKVYCKHVRSSGFDFDFCDTLANRTAAFMEQGSIDILAEGIFALLYMGTSHNRWYVERKAVRYFMGDIEERLLKRMIMEIRIDGQKFCSAIKHLFHSINYSMESLNPKIQETIKEICSK
jgi:eukaryotic-like serine/threonine-protein kinase